MANPNIPYRAPPPYPGSGHGAFPPQNPYHGYQAPPPPPANPIWNQYSAIPPQQAQPAPGPGIHQFPYPQYQTYRPHHHHYPPPTAASSSSPPGTAYPYVSTAKRQMTLLTPDRTRPLLTVCYPSSWSSTQQLTIHRGDGPHGPELGGAVFHSFTTDKVDAYLVRGGAMTEEYRFKKKFESRTGLGLAGTAKMVWEVEKPGYGWRALVLRESGKDGPVAARFVMAEDGCGGKGGYATIERVEGRLEVVRAGGLAAEQFEEVFLTLVAEMERKRRDKEMDIVGEVFSAAVEA
ncbi:hypothetical protein MMYC01_207145 [Madurella mycetomatis]|uniref:Uncharacterized protein n=1 Tax=Madurella mycetomatis TaxID=100816 RepID=A0A175W153_9PEZI|nr:hypothetical protein MMYC01_207145 [Madurella mycetomatis]